MQWLAKLMLWEVKESWLMRESSNRWRGHLRYNPYILQKSHHHLITLAIHM